MRHVFGTMGTVVSIALDHDLSPAVLAEVEEVFAGYDRTFSLYRTDSPLSAIARGDLALPDAPERVRGEYERATQWRLRTNGWFDPHRPDGALDLSGTIKAVAIEAAGAVLERSGASGIIGAGGDLLVIGAASHWIGIADPADRGAMLGTVALGARRAAATSGSAERGDHIWARSGATDIVQATVLADDIVTADVLATAVVAAGTAGMDEVLVAADADALVMTAAGLSATPGWPRAAVAWRP